MSDPFIPVNTPLLGEGERDRLVECIDTAWISSEGRTSASSRSGAPRWSGAVAAWRCRAGRQRWTWPWPRSIWAKAMR